MDIVITFFILLILFTVVIFLQIKLAGFENKYLGFIIPALFLIVSIIGILSNIKPDDAGTGREYRIVKTADGREVRELVESINPAPDRSKEYMILYLLLNIPTVALVVLYFIVRRRSAEELENLEDLDTEI